jgi:signal transduction histidine kinase
VTFLIILYYCISVLNIQNIFLLSGIFLSLVILSAFFISKLAVDPLSEHMDNLQRLSRETLHELNLPISTIKTNSQLIKKNLEDEKMLKRLQRIETASLMLEQRYNELDYMIKTQTMQNIQEKFDLSELIEDRIEFISLLYPQIDFQTQLISTQITNDKIGLSKVIDNIIDNGVKYAPNSKVIKITLKNYQLSIQDYGCGMDEIELLQIFDSCYQNDVTIKGFGIGLSMVKRFCDKQKIHLTFKSKPDVGTTVILKFKKD